MTRRSTIDFGIQLGNMNAAIAVIRGSAVEIIKNNHDNERTPCAIFIDKRGQVHVGQRAKNRLEDQTSANDVHIEFRRRMGTDSKYEFKTAGRELLPEEVSAEVLKSLRGDVQQRLGEDVQACVITVPAAFEQRQCVATMKAAEFAGFSECQLINEPVAAALAYGFQTDAVTGYFMVYDFGGGTFDAAVMKSEEGSLHVINHGGDNFLGGSNIDWEIVEKLIVPDLKKNYNLPDFARGNKKWLTAFAVIKRAAESAKIQLSRSDSAYLEDCKFKDADGEEIELNFKLTRNDMINVAEPIIMRSIDICKRVLKEKNFSPSALERVILVGGPTLDPYFRDILKDHLGIQLDHSVDPLTVLVRGAAIFAGTQRIEGKARPKAAGGQFKAELLYNTWGGDLEQTVMGKISSADGISPDGFTVELISRTSETKEFPGWQSGKISVDEDGKFMIGLVAKNDTRNIYEIELLDNTGRKQTIVPDTLVYTTVDCGISMQQVAEISTAPINPFQANFVYRPIGLCENPLLRGFITTKLDCCFKDISIDFENAVSGWSSGRIPLTTRGCFKVNLTACRGAVNRFQVKLFNRHGQRMEVSPDSLEYSVGLTEPAQTVVYDIGISSDDSEVDIFFINGDSIPATVTRTYSVSSHVRKGRSEDNIRIVVVESCTEQPMCQRVLGKLKLSGSSIRNDINEGDSIIITLVLEKNRTLRMKMTIPSIEAEFEAVIDNASEYSDRVQIKQEYDAEMRRFEILRNAMQQSILIDLPQADSLTEIENTVRNMAITPGSAWEAEKQLIEIKEIIDKMEEVIITTMMDC